MDKELDTTGQLTLAISLELGEGIWEVTLVSGQDPGDPVPKLWSQSSTSGGGAGGKSVREEGPGSQEEADSVARMGFLGVPLRAGRGPGPCQVAVPSTQLPGGGAAVPSTRASRALELPDSAWLDQRRSRTAQGAG